LEQLNLKGISMIHYLERFLVILGAFQPFITFLIGCAAVFISVKTYKNARMSRQHEEFVQLSKIKRDLYVLNSKYYSNFVALENSTSRLSELLFKADFNDLDEDDLKTISNYIDELTDSASKRLTEAEIIYEKKVEYINSISTINDALEELYKLESAVIQTEAYCHSLHDTNEYLVNLMIRAKISKNKSKKAEE